MYTYEITIRLNNRHFNIVVNANNDRDARTLVMAQYPTCQITRVVRR